jgi:HEAT repeat protein
MIRMIRASLLALPCLLVVSCASNVDSPGKTSVAELITALESPDPSVQVQTLAKLNEMGEGASDATPAIVRLLKSRDKNVRRQAAAALGRVAAAEEAVAPLTEMLRDPDISVRQQAATSLGMFGPAASSALPDLERIAKEPDRCSNVASAIKNIRR